MKLEPDRRFSNKQYILRLIRFFTITVILAGLFLVVALVQIQAHAFTTPNRHSIRRTPADINLPYEDVTLVTGDGLAISSWYIPGAQPNAVILVHGLSNNRESNLPEAKLLAEAGYHLLLIDLRGHGASEGNDLSFGYYEALDVQAAVDYLMALPDVERVGAMGSSLGGAVIVRAAAEDPRLGPLVVISSYSNLLNAVDDAFNKLSRLPRWPFAPLIVGAAENKLGLEISQIDSARDLANLSPPRPVFIIHGAEDHLFPVCHAQKMYDAARAPKTLWIIEGMDHVSPIQAHETEFRERLLLFFRQAFAQ